MEVAVKCCGSSAFPLAVVFKTALHAHHARFHRPIARNPSKGQLGISLSGKAYVILYYVMRCLNNMLYEAHTEKLKLLVVHSVWVKGACKVYIADLHSQKCKGCHGRILHQSSSAKRSSFVRDQCSSEMIRREDGRYASCTIAWTVSTYCPRVERTVEKA